MSQRVGQVIGGRFRIVRQLGEGGMGTVYLARHVELDEFVALKFLKGEVAGDAVALERMRREARAVAKLRGEGVARVLDTGVADDGAAYLVLEYVQGRTWSEVLREGKMPCDAAVDVALGIAVTLAEAHRCGLVHRDLKPSNVIVSERPDGTPLIKLLDFGIAKHAAPDVRALTETSALLGSPTYMAPEQIRDAKGVDARADIWSLAVMLYQAVTGELPFRAFTVPALLAKIAADPPVDPRHEEPSLPEGLSVALLRALQKDPAARFANIADFAEAIGGAASTRGALEVPRVRATLQHAPRTEPHGALEADAEASAGAGADRTGSLRTRTLGATTVTHPHSGSGEARAGAVQATAQATKPKAARALLLLGAAATALLALAGTAAWQRSAPAQDDVATESARNAASPPASTASAPANTPATVLVTGDPRANVGSALDTAKPATRQDASASRAPHKAAPHAPAPHDKGTGAADANGAPGFVDDFGPRK